MPQNIEALLEQRVKEWVAPHESHSRRRRRKRDPSITISHSMGSYGVEIASAVSEALGFHLYDRQIVDMVAEKAKVQRSLVEALDERLQTHIERYITSVLKTHYLDPDQHFRMLMKAISAIGAQGGAVIVGRGAGLYLDRDRTVSIRVDAPLDLRVERVSRNGSLPLEEARARVARSDANRGAYLRQHFHVAWGDPLLYDLTINTEHTPVPATVRAVVACAEERFPGLLDGSSR